MLVAKGAGVLTGEARERRTASGTNATGGRAIAGSASVRTLPVRLSSAAMPATWRPWGGTHRTLSSAPWSKREADDVTYAIRTGFKEIVDHFEKRPGAVKALEEDAIGSVIEVIYAGEPVPGIGKIARAVSRRNLEILAAPYLNRGGRAVTGRDYQLLAPLAIFAWKLFPDGDAKTSRLVDLANAALRASGGLSGLMKYDPYRKLDSGRVSVNELFDMVIWSLLFTEAELVPGLDVAKPMRSFTPRLWRFLRSYKLKDAEDYREGAWNKEFVDIAYLATHIAYIPTGNHRHPIYIQDSPELYRFHRENFYAVLQMGELDLVAEFVDTLRQYGFTEENDLQVRDGTRFLLRLFHENGDRWMNYREPGEKKSDDYDLVHKAWTGILGIRPREPEPSTPGTYGGVIRRWLPKPV